MLMNVHKKFTIFLVFLAVLAIPTYAETTYIDAQKWTTCVAGSCVTTVPLDEFLNSGLITALKAIDLTPAKPVLTDKLLSFDYRFEGNNMIFYGDIANNVYWTFNLGNSFVIDPWWNITTPYTWTGIDLDDDGSTAYRFGYTISLNCTSPRIEWVSLDSDCDASAILIYNMGETLLSNTSLTDKNSTVGFAINSSQYYYIMANGNSQTYTRAYKYPWTAYPNQTSPYLTVNSSVGCEPACANLTNSANNIGQIGYSCLSSQIYYTISFELNGNSSNLTVINTTTINATEIANVTGLNSTIYRNGTVLNTSLANNTYWLGTVPVGLHNFTLATNNSDLITYWVNATATASAPVVNYTYGLCTSNTTLLLHDTGFYNGSFNYTDTYTLCPYGCDNVTFSCSPAPFIQDLVNYSIIFVFAIIAIFIGVKLARRK